MPSAPPPPPPPTESEFAILRVLWREGPCTVRKVRRHLGEKSGYTTVLKFLQIMFEKNLVRRDDSAVTHIYEAAVDESTTKQNLVGTLIDRAFAGSAAELVQRALSARPVSADELRAIRKLLAETAKKQISK
ncbi:BlaI/MecI/CopY family transcriptional regulator [Geminisphaera colitermitum]|uniref:BlaI/MecI/CopY family transcriptional regulator n=1 Tax=Geminisphaera colitermitum TaxID=1148786 RepID=UPI0001965568|nr:BlaI/MecI/CopY family transcriptional regulator [Geminisphaera colitermitum]